MKIGPEFSRLNICQNNFVTITNSNNTISNLNLFKRKRNVSFFNNPIKFYEK